MYDTDDFVTDQTQSEFTVSINKMPIVTEVKIGDKTIAIVNPEYVESLQKKLTYMDNKIRFLENEIKTLRSNLRIKIAEVENSIKYYDNDYDR